MTTADKDIRYAITAEDRFSRAFGQLKRDIAGSRNEFGGLISTANAVSMALGSITLGAAGAGGLAVAIKQLANNIDALNDAADATGSSIENLSALEDVARRNGQSLDTVVSAALRLNKVLNDATPGSATEQTLRRLGLSAAELRDQDPAIAIQELGKALASFADDGYKGQAILALTGKTARELAPFFKDVAESGKLVAKVTTEQAQQAEKFNKELFALQTNASNTARALVADLIPALNKLFDDKRSGGISKMLGIETLSAQMDQAVATYRLIGLARERITPLSILEKDPTNERALAELARIDARAKSLAATFKDANREKLKLVDNGAGAGRGFINPEPYRGSIGPVPADSPRKPALDSAARVSEAQRYLEQLQKQGEKLQELSVYEQLLADIEAKRIDGITPKLRRELEIAAQRVDLQKQYNVEKEREAGFQKLISDKNQRDIDEVQRLLEQTPGGRRQGLENQADKLLAFSRSIGEEDPRQKQVLEALQRIRKETADLANPVQDAANQFDKLADTIDKTMDRATQAFLDFALEGKGSIEDVGKAFARDVLRSLIEEPMRDTMKAVSKSIAEALKTGDIMGQLSGFFKGSGGSGGFDVGDILSSIAGFFGYTGRSGGGGVKGGSLVRWQENGREWFVPGADGAVVNQAQMRNMSGGVQQTNNIVINGGGDPREVQRQIDAALARNNAALVRSMRTGGAMAG